MEGETCCDEARSCLKFARHLLSRREQKVAIRIVDAHQQSAHTGKVARFRGRGPPRVAAREPARSAAGPGAIAKNLVHRDLECPGKLFQCVHGRGGITALNSRNVGPQQADSPFDVSQGEPFLGTEETKPLSDVHAVDYDGSRANRSPGYPKGIAFLASGEKRDA